MDNEDTGTRHGRRSPLERLIYVKEHSETLRNAIRRLPRWVTPNVVTCARTVLIVPIVWLMLDGRFLSALTVFALAMALDALDGMIAEINELKSEFGAFLDPLADKILTCGTLLTALTVLPAAFIAPIMVICLTALALTLTRILLKVRAQNGYPQKTVAASTAGKMKTITEVATIALLFITLAAGSPMALVAITFCGLILATVLGIMSLRTQVQKL